MKISSNLQLAGLIIFILLIAGIVVFTSRTTSHTTTSTSAFASSSNISLEGYCKDGYYKIPTESKVCSRAPKCGGYTYDQLNTDAWRFGMTGGSNSHNVCMGDGADRATNGCAGYVPLCCYEMARTGDYTKCVGYWERLWCAPVQCREAESNGANQGQCGGNCSCGDAFGSYCGDKSVVPLTQRLGVQQPTNTQAPAPPTNTPHPPIATNTPIPQQPTHTPAPNQPTNTPPPTNTSVPHVLVSQPAQQPIGIIPPVIRQITPQEERRNMLPTILTKQEIVQRLESATAQPLAVVNTSYDAVIAVDQAIEALAKRLAFQTRISLLKLFQ